MKEEDFLLATAGKSGSLVEFMQLENNVKMSTMKSIEGAQGFVGDSFQVDGLADSHGTELTEILDPQKARQDDSIAREQQERESFQKKHGLMN